MSMLAPFIRPALSIVLEGGSGSKVQVDGEGEKNSDVFSFSDELRGPF